MKSVAFIEPVEIAYSPLLKIISVPKLYIVAATGVNTLITSVDPVDAVKDALSYNVNVGVVSAPEQKTPDNLKTPDFIR